MRTTIELPESTFRGVEEAARAQGVTIDEFILRTFGRELAIEALPSLPSRRLNPPLLASNAPGTMDLGDFNFDDLLA